jgi:hypothetical protein
MGWKKRNLISQKSPYIGMEFREGIDSFIKHDITRDIDAAFRDI